MEVINTFMEVINSLMQVITTFMEVLNTFMEVINSLMQVINTFIYVMVAKFCIQKPSREYRFNLVESEISLFTVSCLIRLGTNDFTLYDTGN